MRYLLLLTARVPGLRRVNRFVDAVMKLPPGWTNVQDTVLAAVGSGTPAAKAIESFGQDLDKAVAAGKALIGGTK